MKTLFLISNTRIGGAENFTLRLVEGLKQEFPDSLFDVLVTHKNGDLDRHYRATFDTYSTAFACITQEQKIERVKQACGGYDLIHSVDNFDMLSSMTADGWRCDAPILQNVFLDVSIRDHLYVRSMIQAMAPNIAAFTTEMPQNIEALPEPERKPHAVRQIPNGIDTAFWCPSDTKPEKKVCWVGRLTERKGGRTLEQLIRRLPDVLLTVVANERNTDPGFLHRDFTQLAKECSNLDYRWTLSPEDLREVYRSSQVYLHTSLSEAQPGTLLEAMSCGCFPVCGGVGGVPEIVNGRGFLVSMGEGDIVERFSEMLLCALNDAGHLRSARERIISHFSLDSAVQKYAALYREILEVR